MKPLYAARLDEQLRENRLTGVELSGHRIRARQSWLLKQGLRVCPSCGSTWSPRQLAIGCPTCVAVEDLRAKEKRP